MMEILFPKIAKQTSNKVKSVRMNILICIYENQTSFPT